MADPLSLPSSTKTQQQTHAYSIFQILPPDKVSQKNKLIQIWKSRSYTNPEELTQLSFPQAK